MARQIDKETRRITGIKTLKAAQALTEATGLLHAMSLDIDLPADMRKVYAKAKRHADAAFDELDRL